MLIIPPKVTQSPADGDIESFNLAIQPLYASKIHRIKNLMTGLKETANLSVNFPNVDKRKYVRKGGVFL